MFAYRIVLATATILCVDAMAQTRAQQPIAVQLVSSTGTPACTPALTGKGKPVRWEVVAAPGAPGDRAVAETTRDRTDERYPLCIHEELSAANVDVTLSFKPVDGKDDRAGGIAVRLRDADTYYVVRANALEDNVRLYYVLKGVRRQFAGKDGVKVASGQWHTLRLRVVGDTFEVFFNGQPLFTARDTRITAAGKVAVWTKADSLTQFGAMTVTVLP
jgi:hypothetical protein